LILIVPTGQPSPALSGRAAKQRPEELEPLPEAILCGQVPEFQISYRAVEEEGIICRLSDGK